MRLFIKRDREAVMKNFIDPEELLNNINDFKIIDCRFNMNEPGYSEKEYSIAHIINACYMDLEKDLSSSVKEHGGRHPLPDIDIFVKKLESFGIENNSHIVVYDDDLTIAPRLWWLIRYIGLDNVKILNGGFKRWKQNKFPLENAGDRCKERISSVIKVNLRFDMLADIEDVKDAIKNGRPQLIDSRSPERYKGIIEPIDKIAGRIPSAINIFYQNALEDNHIKKKVELKSVYGGINSLDEPIFYCGSGVTAAINIVAADEIDIKSRLYAGSYSDYISYKENKVERDA